jgi:butyryl-CoA dehydrogenase
MDFSLSEESRMLQEMVRSFADEKLKPRAVEIDQTCSFPWDSWREMGELGLLGMLVPEEYGGPGMTNLDYVTALEEVSVGCAATAAAMSVQNSLAIFPIQTFGTDAQKEKYLPKLASGEWVGCYGLTEPGAGSDAASLKTSCVKQGDRWILNGAKQFITNAPEAQVTVMYATKDPAMRTKGICAFILEKDFPGYSVGKKEEKMGIRGSTTASIIFEDCEVPEENLLGEEGRGFSVAMATLDGGRIGIGAQGLGIARAALEAATEYAQQREQFGAPIARLQAIQWKLADMVVRIDAVRLLTQRAAWLKDQGASHSMECSIAKLMAAETAVWCANQAVQIHGGYGYTKEYVVERLYRDAKITDLYEGTSEIQRLVIATNLLKGVYRGAETIVTD